MAGKDIFIALGVVLIWSINLLVQKFVVSELSVFIVSFLRLGLIAPLIYFCPKPQKALSKYIFCALFWNVGYLLIFGFGLQSQMGAGMASFFLQTQVFFGILCCYLLLREKPKSYEMLGIIMASCGILLLSSQQGLDNISIEGTFLLLGSCLSWGIGFAFLKKYKIGSTLSDVIWLAAMSVIPLCVASLFFEGIEGTVQQIAAMSLPVWGGIIFAAFGSTLFTTSLWLGLIQKATASAVTPFMLLLPIFSVILAYIFMGETPSVVQIFAGSIILFGVMVSQNLHQHLYRFLKMRLRSELL